MKENINEKSDIRLIAMAIAPLSIICLKTSSWTILSLFAGVNMNGEKRTLVNFLLELDKKNLRKFARFFLVLCRAIVLISA